MPETTIKPNHYCIQCTDRLSGKVGDFAYHTDKPFEAISPVFSELWGLFDWLKQHSLKISRSGYDLEELV